MLYSACIINGSTVAVSYLFSYVFFTRLNPFFHHSIKSLYMCFSIISSLLNEKKSTWSGEYINIIALIMRPALFILMDLFCFVDAEEGFS